MARTAPVPNMVAIPGMNPGIFVLGGGGDGGGSGAGGGKGKGKGQGANGKNSGQDANGDGRNACRGQGGQARGCPNHHGGNSGRAARGDPVDVVTGRVFEGPLRDAWIRAERAEELVREVEHLPPPDREAAIATLGTALARVGQGARLVPAARASSRGHAALAVALGDPRSAAELAPALKEYALCDETLLARVGAVARAFDHDSVKALLGRALEIMAADLRSASLAGDGVSLVAVAPLIGRMAGGAGLLAAGTAVATVVRAFP